MESGGRDGPGGWAGWRAADPAGGRDPCTGGTLRLDAPEVLASQNGAAHVQRVTAEHQGRRLDCVEVLAHRIVDSLIVHTYHRPDEYAIDTFLG
jgi:hypothetical protein